jgi:hypothetical protein
MKTKWLKIVLLALAVGGLWFTYAAIRAHRKLVTLDVRRMAVRDVVDKIEWQTWEDIYVDKEVTGTVTLNVKNMPLENLLEIIGEQTSSRWTSLYPVYSSRKSLNALKHVLTGELRAETNGWKSFRFGRAIGSRGPDFFGASNRDENKLITLNLVSKDIDVAAMSISRFSRALVLPEDAAKGKVSLLLNDATVDDAVKQLASRSHLNWTRLYALQGSRFGGPGGPRDRDRGRRPEFAGSETNGGSANLMLLAQNDRTNGPPRFGDGPPSDREGMREEFRERMEKQLEAMSPEERQRFEERRKEFENMRNMSPEDRRKEFEKMMSRPEVQQQMRERMVNNIKNTTAEQRAERDKRGRGRPGR